MAILEQPLRPANLFDVTRGSSEPPVVAEDWPVNPTPLDPEPEPGREPEPESGKAGSEGSPSIYTDPQEEERPED